MAKTLPLTTTITIDDDTYDVSKMSNDVQQMVNLLDEWRQDEADQVSQLLKTRGALRDIQTSILQQIGKEKKEAELQNDSKIEEPTSTDNQTV